MYCSLLQFINISKTQYNELFSLYLINNKQFALTNKNFASTNLSFEENNLLVEENYILNQII